VKNFILGLMALSFIVACSPANETLTARYEVPPPPEPIIPHFDEVAVPTADWITLDGGQTQMEFNPQVDILFVVDNSASMSSAQDNLSNNIDTFASKFQQNKMIDYHIGVVSVWDSGRFTEGKDKTGFSLGELRNVKSASGKVLDSRFVTKDENVSKILSQTLKIGYMPLGSGGPENEEIFSPISAALQLNGRGATNEGFFRENARLVVIILTDAEDSTPSMSPDQLAQELFQFKNNKKDQVSVYAALVKKSDPEDKKDDGLKVTKRYHPECFDQKGKSLDNQRCNEGFGADRIEEFVIAANIEQGSADSIRSKNIMSIVQTNFGKDLARIGSDISAKTLAKEILLDLKPRQNADGSLMIRVRYGSAEDLSIGKGQIIPAGQQGGWVFNPSNNSILLAGDVKYSYKEGARFAIDMVPVTIRK
jgi:hypothetical protein